MNYTGREDTGLILRIRSILNATDEEGKTPLIWAAKEGDSFPLVTQIVLQSPQINIEII